MYYFFFLSMGAKMVRFGFLKMSLIKTSTFLNVDGQGRHYCCEPFHFHYFCMVDGVYIYSYTFLALIFSSVTKS